MKDMNMVFAGFGGQGVLFAGKVAAYAGLIEGKEISWLPSYGPEMRLIAMNLPSLERFIDAVEPGGTVILDSSLIDREIARTDISVYRVPSSRMAEENGLKGLSNMILVGKLFHELGFCSDEVLDEAITKCIPPRKASMLELNRKAVALGAAQ